MDRPFHISRSVVQLVTRRHPYFENVAYSTSSYTRLQTDEWMNDQVSVSGRISKDNIIYTDGCVGSCQTIHSTSRQHATISGQSSEGLNSFKFGTIPTDWKMKYHNRYMRLSKNGPVINSSSQQGQSGLKYNTDYILFSQVPLASSTFGFPPTERCLGRNFSTSAASSAPLGDQQNTFNRDDELSLQPHEPEVREPNIRERLHIWETEYRAQRSSDFQYELLPSEIALARHDQAELFDEGAEHEFEDIPYPIYDRGENVDVDSQRPYLLRGDMVELRASNCFRIELAIFVRAIGSHYQYYTMSGKWIHQKPRLAKYCVQGFVSAEELDPLLAFLPSKAVPEALQHKLQNFEHALPRDVGSPLIKKMLDFWIESDRIYRDAALNLDNAHELVASTSSMRYESLPALANKLLPKDCLKDGHLPAPALYALHRSLLQNELGFRPQKWHHRTTNQFEIVPISEIELARTVGNEIRKYQRHLIGSASGIQDVKDDSTARFIRFLRKVRNKIDESRRTRKYTPHGMIGPKKRGVGGKVDAEVPKVLRSRKNKFDAFDWRYIRFVTSWAALRTVQNHSYLHGIASTILRATGMYPDTMLDQRVGWTFLQEVGVIAPWEIRTHFEMRLPSVMREIMPPEKPPETEQLNTGRDVLDGLRKDWGNLPVYCIDDTGASEIDDGVSIEPAESGDEYWVHIHVADPASMIIPRSVVAKKAMSATRSIYLPDRSIDMLPREVVQEHLSLAPDRRCLTFSGLINLEGKLLDKKVTPGVLRNVMYMTPATLLEVVGETSSVRKTVIMVGDNTAKPRVKSLRHMAKRHEMTENDKKNLGLLHTLGNARQNLSSSRGNIMFSSPSYEITVTTNGELTEHGKNPLFMNMASDPRIDLKVEQCSTNQKKAHGNTVMSLMLLAGEVGARWCQERGIPIINRISQPHPDDPDPREYFRRVIVPLINRSKETNGDARNCYTEEGIESDNSSAVRAGSSQSQTENIILPTSSEAPETVPLDVALEYQRLLGAVIPSTTPGPHLHIGLDMFTRNTSPLRRFSDLLVHWQIEAALIKEAVSGQSLIGSTRDDYLPYKKDELDRFTPFLHWREIELRSHERAAQRVWAMQLLLRAWKFNEAPLPPTFELWAHTLVNRTITGHLSYLGGLSATFELPNWLLGEDFHAGDIFEVKLADLDIYNQLIEVSPLRRLRRTAERVI